MSRKRDPIKKKQYQHNWYVKHKQEQRERIAKQRSETIRWFEEYKTTLRCLCGETHPALLDFHHRDMNEKELSITSAVYGQRWGKKRILEEISKCDVLCCKCHRLLHWKQKHSLLVCSGSNPAFEAGSDGSIPSAGANFIRV